MGHECSEFVMECCKREGFNIGGTNTVNLYPLELKGSLQFSDIGDVYWNIKKCFDAISKFEVEIDLSTVSQKLTEDNM